MCGQFSKYFVKTREIALVVFLPEVGCTIKIWLALCIYEMNRVIFPVSVDITDKPRT